MKQISICVEIIWGIIWTSLYFPFIYLDILLFYMCACACIFFFFFFSSSCNRNLCLTYFTWHAACKQYHRLIYTDQECIDSWFWRQERPRSRAAIWEGLSCWQGQEKESLLHLFIMNPPRQQHHSSSVGQRALLA